MDTLKLDRAKPFKWWQSVLVFVGILICFCLLMYLLFTLWRFAYIDRLIDNLQSSGQTEDMHPVTTLSKIGTPAVEPLIRALKYRKDSNVRINVARVLGKIKDPRAVEPLIAALKDTDGTVRSQAALALGE